MKNKVQLITYADRLGAGTLASMTDILRTRFDGVYEGVHILPFFTPFDGADAGFDPIDHTAVDPRLGGWDDVAELARTHGIMVDAIVNHMSWESSQFQDVLAKGEESKYFPMFLMMSTVYPDGATEEELAGIYRPRPGLPFTHYTCGGRTRLVWTTFTPQQVDIDTDSEQGWAYLMSIFDRMAASHVSYIRLDAVGYGAKEADSSCFMTPKTFELIGRLREEGAKEHRSLGYRAQKAIGSKFAGSKAGAATLTSADEYISKLTKALKKLVESDSGKEKADYIHRGISKLVVKAAIEWNRETVTVKHLRTIDTPLRAAFNMFDKLFQVYKRRKGSDMQEQFKAACDQLALAVSKVREMMKAHLTAKNMMLLQNIGDYLCNPQWWIDLWDKPDPDGHIENNLYELVHAMTRYTQMELPVDDDEEVVGK